MNFTPAFFVYLAIIGFLSLGGSHVQHIVCYFMVIVNYLFRSFRKLGPIILKYLNNGFVQQRAGYQRQAPAIICTQIAVVQAVEPNTIQSVHILADVV